jgi:adenine-specific DNA-methyltransferase
MMASGKIQTRLEWEGKRTQVEKIKLPFQVVETVNEPRTTKIDTFLPRTDKWYNMLIWGDNKLVMSSLLPEFAGKIDLIYIDPPFATGADFRLVMRIGNDSEVVKEPSAIEEKAYRDTWGQGLASYLQMMYDRLVLMRELLSLKGSIFIHLDWHVGHYVKVILDEIFGIDNFRNEIIIKRGRKKSLMYQFEMVDRMHVSNDVILWYSKSPDAKFKHPLSDKEGVEAKWMGFWSNVDRPTMRYELFGYTPSRGQWKWSRERALKAVENYRIYEEKYSKQMSLEEYWEFTGRKLEFIRKREGTKYPEYWVPPRTSKILDNIWFDVESYNYTTGFPTEKHEELLTRIISQFSEERDLVADFFCGSGTTLVAAEKLSRRWIGCDLSKFAIHLARKRLLDIPGCKPFQILNLGKYQKQKLIENGNGGERYVRFMLELYNATPLQGFAYIHGKKGSRLVHIGPIDSFVTLHEIREVAREAANVNAGGIDILGWDFEMGLHGLLDEVTKEYGVDIKLKQIPNEVLEIKSGQGSGKLEELRFFDLNYLDVDLKTKGREVTVTLKKFVIANPEYIPEEVRETIKNFTAYIDYWAVDFDYKGDVFHNMRQEYRTKKNPNLQTSIKYQYENPGHYKILVKVVDILGNDTNKLLTVRIT